MNFCLLHADEETAQLAVALVAAGHELALLYEPGESAAALRAVAPEARVVAEWEEALACGANFAVIGGAGPESQRLEMVRRLVQEGLATIVSHPQTTATLAYFELDMHRQATNVALVPLETRRHQPALGAVRRLGMLDEVVIERRLADRSKAAVLREFVRDLGAVRTLVGECEKVSAMGTLGDDGGSAQLGVNITTKSGALIRWSIGPGSGTDSARWTVTAKDASAEFSFDDAEEWSVVVSGGGATEKTSFPAGSTMHATAGAVAEAVRDPTNELWREALADLELVEAVERSLRKGRTVELFHEEASEEGTFHGVMAAGGCLLIMLSIGAAIAATMIGRFRFWLADFWPFALLAVLVAFLLLQLLKLVFPKS